MYYLNRLEDSEHAPDQRNLDDFLSYKASILEDIINDLISDIKKREYLSKKLIQKLDEKVCLFKTLILELERLSYKRRIDYKRISLEKEILKIEREKIRELVDAWRDITSLKRDLRVILKEYLTLKRFM